MGVPQVPDQVKRAPTLALRAVFSGIGRILLAADRPQAPAIAPDADAWPTDPEDQRQRGADRRPPRSGAVPPAQMASRWRSLDETGNVRLLSAKALADDYGIHAAAEPAAQALPLHSYDSLSLASIRARLRGLSVGQLRILLDYERENAERPDVLGMFERRIEKLESGR